MTIWPALLLLAVSSQEPKQLPFNKPLPTVPSITWSLGENATVQVTYEFVRTRDGRIIYQCWNECLGNKHFDHGQCDDSCDTRCEKMHNDPDAEFFLREGADSQNSIQALVNQFGAGAQIQNLANSVSFSIGKHAQDNLGSMANLNIDLPRGHWVKNPCTVSERKVLHLGFRLVAHVQLFRTTLRQDGSVSTVEGPKTDVVVGYLEVPTDDITYGTFEICQCVIVTEGYLEEENEEVGGVFIDPDNTDSNTEMQFCNSTLQGQVGLTCTADSMTSCTFTATNPTDKEIEICIYPGTELISSDEKTQNIGTSGIVWLVIPPGKSGPFLPSTVSVKVRAVCLNMNKKEPDASSKFKIGGPLPDPLRRLARFSDKERFKSVVEQIRVWIVTDQATLPEVQKHLMFPKPTAGQYLRALETVATVGKVDLTEAKYAKCLDPTLIGGAPTTSEAVDNFVEVLETANPQGLAKAASNAKTFESLWVADALKYGAEHAAWVAKQLGSSSDKALQTAAGQFLTNIVPAERREAVALAGGLTGVGTWLGNADEDRAKKALEILRTYKSKSSIFYLFNVNVAHPESLRNEAKALADELMKPLERNNQRHSFLR